MIYFTRCVSNYPPSCSEKRKFRVIKFLCSFTSRQIHFIFVRFQLTDMFHQMEKHEIVFVHEKIKYFPFNCLVSRGKIP